jgi:RNA 3'-terminal phosphate cyclase (ATP)
MAAELPILLDGGARPDHGGGGGQILRTALSLACVTGRAFTIHRLRAGRPQPGLRPQHREAARAAARLCDAELVGDELGSARLEFRPRRRATPVEATFDVGTAGSTALLLQTLCWPLSLAGGPSTLTLRGGTHQDLAPSFHFLALAWAPAVARLGFKVELSLQAAGFSPEGGGELTARVEPAHPMPPLDLRHRGTLRDVEVLSFSGGVAHEYADRQAIRAVKRLRALGVAAEAERVPLPVRGSRGGHVLVVADFERVRSGHGAVTARNRTPEAAAEAAVAAFQSHLEGRGAVSPQLADQLVIPAALVAAGLVPPPPGVVPATRYTVSEVTEHLVSSAEVVRRFLDVELAVLGRPGEPGEVRVQPPGAGLEVLPLDPGAP